MFFKGGLQTGGINQQVAALTPCLRSATILSVMRV
jgi:hypothetical protein